MKAALASFLLFAAALVTAAPARAEATPGRPAPAFTLKDIEGDERSLADFAGEFVVLEWVNYDCPFVKKHYGSGNMQDLQREYTDKGVVWLSVNSSAEGKQGNYPAEKWKKLAAERGVASTAVLLDPTGETGKAYGAKTTPHIFIVDPQGTLIYQGAIDSVAGTDPGEIEGAENYARKALDEAMAGKPVSQPSTRSYGCSVKY